MHVPPVTALSAQTKSAGQVAEPDPQAIGTQRWVPVQLWPSAQSASVEQPGTQPIADGQAQGMTWQTMGAAASPWQSVSLAQGC